MEPEDETATVPEVQDLTPRAQTPPETPMPVPQNEEPDTGVTPLSDAPDAASPARPAPSKQTPASGQEDLDATDTPGPPMRPLPAAEPGPLETRMESMQEERQTSSSIPPTPFAPGPGSGTSFPEASEPSGRQVLSGRSPRRESLTTTADGRNPLPGLRFESAPRVESTRRDFEETPRRLVPKDSPSSSHAADYGQQRAMLSPTTALAEPARVTAEAPAPPPGAGDYFEASEVTPKSEIVQAHRAVQGAAKVVVPRIVRHQPDQREESGPREASVLAPESPAPTIKVAIGRIEVRSVTPPAPARRETPARPGPPLSLDDYLAQRNGGR
jgi:hypothetical protein